MIAEDEQLGQLEIDPESFLTFELHRPPQGGASSDASKCTMTLRHPGGGNNNCFAFKVKTTQPRRYLVRPNQGIIAPNKSETISILLVAKDKQSLIQSFDRLGPSALEHSKDKFLVQSCIVSQDFSDQFMYSNDKNKDLSDALTSMWNNPSNSSNVALQNKKLHVKHVVVDLPNSTSAPVPSMNTAPHLPISSADNSSLVAEITSLRKKYDELVAFSVSLTAERDVLNNTLEQTKRELNIEKSARTRLEGAASSPTLQKGMSLGTLLAILVACIAAFIMGLKYGVNDENDLMKIPLVSKFL